MGQKGDAKRARIIEAADDLFYKQGFNATSFADIGRASALPKGNFYFYFPTKDSLLSAVIDHRLEKLKNNLAAMEKAHPTAKGRLMAFAAMPLSNAEDVARFGCPIGSLGAELCKNNSASNDRTIEAFSMINQWLFRQLKDAGVETGRAQRLARRFISQLQGAIVMASTHNDPQWLKDASDDLQAMIENL